MRKLSQHWEASTVNDGASLSLHKHQDSSAQWLYRYSIHERRHEMGLEH